MRSSNWDLPALRDFHGYLYTVNNGSMDVEGYIDSPYGAELERRLLIRTAIENDREAAAEYYGSLGLKKEYMDWDDYYARWTLLTPLRLETGRRCPLVFWLHGGGNSIEAEENMTGYAELAAREGFLLAVPQNTNPDKILEIIQRVGDRYPLDRSRVYLSGFSQGGVQCHSSYMRHPQLFAAAVTTGNDIWRPWDDHQIDFTEEEIERTRALRVPLMQMCGQCEPFSYAPLSFYSKRAGMRGKPWGRPDTFEHPGKNDDLDPTRIHDLSKGHFDSAIFGDPSKAKWRMPCQYEPGPGDDPFLWSMARVNKRMALLGCPARDEAKCREYLTLPQDDARRVTGINGDYEAVEYHLGYRHYTVAVNDAGGSEMYRFVCVQNSPHWVPLTIGELGWRFMKRYSRDERTSRLRIEREAKDGR